jgi:hypothetical protein
MFSTRHGRRDYRWASILIHIELPFEIVPDTSKQFDATTAVKMIAAAVEYRQVEKNTPPVRVSPQERDVTPL